MLLKWQVGRANLSGLVQLEFFRIAIVKLRSCIQQHKPNLAHSEP
jgi:hypothetical protein